MEWKLKEARGRWGHCIEFAFKMNSLIEFEEGSIWSYRSGYHIKIRRLIFCGSDISDFCVDGGEILRSKKYLRNMLGEDDEFSFGLLAFTVIVQQP